MRISDWSSDVCSSDLARIGLPSLTIALGSGASCAKPAEGRMKARAARLTPLTSSFLVGIGTFSAVGDQLVDAAIDLGNRHRSQRQQIGRASCRERVCQYV